MSRKLNSTPCFGTSDLFLVLSHLKSFITMKLKEFNLYINFRMKGVNAESINQSFNIQNTKVSVFYYILQSYPIILTVSLPEH
jgi:hypothetical protein